MNENKRLLCPICFLDDSTTDTYCCEDKCAWWVKAIGNGYGYCAIQELESISESIHTISDYFYSKILKGENDD